MKMRSVLSASQAIAWSHDRIVICRMLSGKNTETQEVQEVPASFHDAIAAMLIPSLSEQQIRWLRLSYKSLQITLGDVKARWAQAEVEKKDAEQSCDVLDRQEHQVGMHATWSSAHVDGHT